MMRFVRVASVLAFCLLSGAIVHAQTSTARADPSLGYLDFTLGATFGHKSSGSVGGEAGIKVMENLDVFLEGGHMTNVGTQDLDLRAARIANAVGATFSAAYRVNFFDVGVRYRWPVMIHPKVHPYVAFGVGVAEVRSETALSVNGTTVPPGSLGIQFGNDLNGALKKPLITFGLGATLSLAARYFVDLSYRYSRIFPKTGEIENDTGINTNRLQVGVGVKF